MRCGTAWPQTAGRTTTTSLKHRSPSPRLSRWRRRPSEAASRGHPILALFPGRPNPRRHTRKVVGVRRAILLRRVLKRIADPGHWVRWTMVEDANGYPCSDPKRGVRWCVNGAVAYEWPEIFEPW